MRKIGLRVGLIGKSLRYQDSGEIFFLKFLAQGVWDGLNNFYHYYLDDNQNISVYYAIFIAVLLKNVLKVSYFNSIKNVLKVSYFNSTT